MSVLVLVVDDEPDVEALRRQQFRRDLRAQRFVIDFATSAADALSRIAVPIEQTLILSDWEGEQHVMQCRSIRRSGQPTWATASSNACF